MVICKSTFFAIIFIAFQAINTPAIACFDDDKLDSFIRSQQPNLLYVWSPRMVLSATQAHLAAEAAKAAGLKFMPLVDGRLPAAEWQSALRTLSATQPKEAEVLAATESLCSPKLIEKDAYAHFPTAFVVKSGEMHPKSVADAAYWRDAGSSFGAANPDVLQEPLLLLMSLYRQRAQRI